MILRKGNRLFVYGIFLDEGNRKAWGMTNPKYATVRDYATFGLVGSGHIVGAYYVPQTGAVLTGLTVDLPDNYDWEGLDALEGGYKRVRVETTSNERVFMYRKG